MVQVAAWPGMKLAQRLELSLALEGLAMLAGMLPPALVSEQSVEVP